MTYTDRTLLVSRDVLVPNVCVFDRQFHHRQTNCTHPSLLYFLLWMTVTPKNVFSYRQQIQLFLDILLHMYRYPTVIINNANIIDYKKTRSRHRVTLQTNNSASDSSLVTSSSCFVCVFSFCNLLGCLFKTALPGYNNIQQVWFKHFHCTTA